MAWLETQVTVQPAAEPVTLAQAKDQCRVDQSSTSDDNLLNGLISAARQHVESYCGIRLITQTLKMRCSAWADFAALPGAPLQSISLVTYLDPNGVVQTLDPAVYSAMLYGLSSAIRLAYNQKWPSVLAVDDAIIVQAIAGYGAAGTSVPVPLSQAMLLMISQWYDVRQDVLIGGRLDPMPNASDALLTNFRR